MAEGIRHRFPKPGHASSSLAPGTFCTFSDPVSLFLFLGVMAQLVERPVRIGKVESSSLSGSTSFLSAVSSVGRAPH